MKKAGMLLLVLFVYNFVEAQVSGVKNIPGDYATLALAITDLNTNGVGAGGVTININAAQTAPSGGYKLGSATLNTTTSTLNPIVINGGNYPITAPTGLYTTSDAVFRLAGTDFVTLNQLNIIESATNTTIATQMERGIAAMSLTSTDACKNLLIQYCTINLNGATQANSNETGILITTQISTSSSGFKTEGSSTSMAGAFENVIIKSNTITNCYSGIAIVGSLSNTYVSSNIQIGGSTLADGNTISMFGSTTNSVFTVCYGIYCSTVGGNYISSNSVTGSSVYGNSYGLYVRNSPENSEVSKNTVSISNESNYNIYAIYQNSTNLISNSQRCDSNIVQNCITNGDSSNFYGIYTNILSSNSLTPFYYVRSNIVNNINLNSHKGNSYLIFYSNLMNKATDGKCINNYVSNVNILNLAGKNIIKGLSFVTHSGGESKGNKLSDISVNNGNDSTTYIYLNEYYINNNIANTTWIIDSNEISNVAFTGLACDLKAIYLENNSTVNTNYVTRNKISNIGIIGGSKLSNVYGLQVDNTGKAFYVTNNQISALYSTGASEDNAIKGAEWMSGSDTSNFFYNNTINLGPSSVITSTGVNYGVSGLAFSAPVNIKNNIIRVNATPNGTGYVSAIRGMFTGTNGVVSSNFASGSSNNILWVPFGSQRNIYAENTLNTEPLVYFNETNDPNFNKGCGLFKSVAGSRATGTYIENNLTNVSTDVYAPSGSSYSESNAVSLNQVTTDFNGTTRSVTPDCGSLEFNGSIVDTISPTISYTIVPNVGFCNNLPTLSATITDLSGVDTNSGTKPRLYFKKSTDLNTIIGNSSSDNGWKYVEASNTQSPFLFTFNPNLLQSVPVVGDVIQYFVVAQDNASVPNVGTNSVGFSACLTSVNLNSSLFPTLATPTINSFTIITPQAITITATALPSIICAGDSAALSIQANGGLSFSWFPSSNLSASNIANPMAAPSSTSSYTIIATDAYGCTGEDTVEIHVNTLPIVNATATDTSICNGNSSTLEGTGASTYVWQPGSLSGSPSVSPTSTTTYTLTGTDANGCSQTDIKTIYVNALPIVSATASDTSICNGNSSTLEGTGASTYVWQPGSLSGSPSVSPTSTTTYTLTGTDANGCVNSATTIINVKSLGSPDCTPITCVIPSNLNATPTQNGSTITWSKGGSADSTLIQLRIKGNNTWNETVVSGETKVFSNLNTSTIYEYRLRSLCTGTLSDFSNIEEFSTLAPPASSMVLEYKTMQTNQTIAVPLYGTNNCVINWGDGTSQSVTESNHVQHTFADAGIHIVSISGSVSWFGGTFYIHLPYLIKIKSWGNLGLTSLQGACFGNDSLIEVPSSIPATVTDCSWMFCQAPSFNQPLNTWDVSAVTNMYGMFYGAFSFNQPLSNWNVSNVTNMGCMFTSAISFNQALNNWNVSNVTNMYAMFASATQFNQPLNNWNVSNVTEMYGMFYDAYSFNQPLNNWNVSNVTSMDQMFQQAMFFNQNLSAWCVTQLPVMPIYFDQDAPAWANPAWRPVWGTCLPQGCSAPNNINVTPSASSVIINWTKSLSANLTQIQLRVKGTTTWGGTSISGESHTFNYLSPNTTYEYRLRSSCTGSHSLFTTVAEFTTMSFTPLPICLAPTNVGHTVNSNSSATIHWTAASNGASYLVQIKPSTSTWAQAGGSTTASTSRTFNYLQPGTSYDYRVRTTCTPATTSNSLSAFSSAGQFTTTGNAPGIAYFETENAIWSVYPNPTNDIVNIDFVSETEEPLILFVVDVTGRRVQTIETQALLGSNQVQISLGSLANGLYIIKSVKGDEVKTLGKVTKQ